MPSSLERAPCDLCGSRRHLTLGYGEVFRGSSVFDFLESSAGRLRVVTCRSCGFIFFSPRLTPAAMRALYAGPFYLMTRLTGAREKVYSRKKIAATAGRNPDFAPEMVRFLRPHFDFAETSILEVRCKSGAFLLEAKKAGAGRLVGFDDFPPNVERCRYLGFEADLFPIHDPPATPVTGTYDLIRLNNVLAHSASPTAALQLFADHLRPGGLLFVEEPDILAKERGPFPVVPFHYWHPTFNAIAALLAAKGFSVVASEERGSLLWVLARLTGERATVRADPPWRVWRHFLKWRLYRRGEMLWARSKVVIRPVLRSLRR